jgi:hypothetical protein
MNALTILRYLFGDAAAIRRVASSLVALPVGLLLVVSAGAARNYDQVYFGDSIQWFAFPLIFSLVSGAWILIFVGTAWSGASLGGKAGAERWRRKLASYCGLFWMTAPIAWLYAIPVERWFDPVTAARYNVTLLAIVSVWRVLLFSRVVSVVGSMPYWRALGRVLVPASVEVMVVAFVFGIGPSILSSMGGLRNSPAEDVKLGAVSTALNLALVALIAGGVLWVIGANVGRPAPPRTIANDRPGQVPWVFLALTAIFWCLVSLKPQREQRLSREAARLAKAEDWPGLVAFLSKHQKEEFAPSVVLPPSPWKYEGARALPSMLGALTPQTPQWIRDMTIASLDVVLPQGVLEPAELVDVLLAADKLPEGPALMAHHAKAFEKLKGDWPGKYELGFDLRGKVESILSRTGH